MTVLYPQLHAKSPAANKNRVYSVFYYLSLLTRASRAHDTSAKRPPVQGTFATGKAAYHTPSSCQQRNHYSVFCPKCLHLKQLLSITEIIIWLYGIFLMIVTIVYWFLQTNRHGGIVCYDHLGEKYYSITSMCEHWGTARKVYEYRISHGWSQEKSLTTPPRCQIKPARD